MTLSQCQRIIDNDFLGEHKKDGSQTDYSNYKDEIQAHLWRLKDTLIEQQFLKQVELRDKTLELSKELLEAIEFKNKLLDIMREFDLLILESKEENLLEMLKQIRAIIKESLK